MKDGRLEVKVEVEVEVEVESRLTLRFVDSGIEVEVEDEDKVKDENVVKSKISKVSSLVTRTSWRWWYSSSFYAKRPSLYQAAWTHSLSISSPHLSSSSFLHSLHAVASTLLIS